jgi:hypothetical protein
MRIINTLLIVLLALLIAILWVAITQQYCLLGSRRIPEERLNELLHQSRRNGKRLATLTRQNAVLTSNTQAILERIPRAPAPGLIPVITAASPMTPYHGPDEPLVIYEAEPVKAPVKKGGRP